MTNKIKILTVISLVSFVLLFMYYKFNKAPVYSACAKELPDMNNLLQYGEKVNIGTIEDRYKNILNMDNYKNAPVLIFFTKANEDKLHAENDSISLFINGYINNGLKVLYITKGEKTPDKRFLDNVNIFYETENRVFEKAFKTKNCPMIMILLNKNKEVAFLAVHPVAIEVLLKIFNNKYQEIF
jgi:hypothetical protein